MLFFYTSFHYATILLIFIHILIIKYLHIGGNNYIIIALTIIAFLLLKKNRENFEIQTDNKIAMSYVINLETDKDRFKILKRQLKHANLPYTRFEAILGKNVSKNDPLYKFYFSEKGKEKLKPAQIGCSLSHIYLWNKISKEPKNNVYLVLEDDAVVPVDFNYRQYLYETAPR